MMTVDPRQILEKLPILQFLSSETRQLVMNSFAPESHPFGSVIIREGENSHAFYVLLSGRVRVVKQSETGGEIALSTLRAGDSFGEMGLLDDAPSRATVRASSDVEVMVLDRAVWRAMLQSHPEIRTYLELQKKHRSLVNFFRLYSPFANLPPEALSTMLDELEPVGMNKGELVVRQGDPPGPMYLVEEGRLRVSVEVNGQKRYVAYLRRGGFFGEMSIFKGAPRSASVEAVSPCRLFRFREETLRKLIRDTPEFQRQLEERIAQYDYKHVAQVPLDFAEEILPAQAAARDQVSADQVDRDTEEEETVEAPFAEEGGRFVKRHGRIRRFHHLFQIDEMDCGAACLGMVTRHFGRNISLSRIRTLAHTDTEGTSLRGLCLAAGDLGLASRAVKASKRNLPQMPLPAVVHWEGNHWVVLWDVNETFVRVADPGLGNRKISRKEFEKKWTGYAALFDYTTGLEKTPESSAGIGWFLPFFKPFKGLLAQAVLLALMVSVMQMVLPVFSQVIVDKVLVEQDVGLLKMMMVGIAAVLFFMTLATVIQRYLLSFAAVRIDSSALDFLTRKLLSLPTSYFSTRRTGDIQRRLQGIRLVREYLAQHGVAALTALVQLLTVLCLMFVYSVKLGLVFMAMMPLYAAFMIFSRRRLRPIFDDLEEAFGKYSSYQIDAIKGMETVKALAAEATFRERMLDQFHRVVRRQFKADFTMMLYEGAVQMTTFLSVALFLWFGALQVLEGQLTIGGLVAFNSLVALANGPITVLLNIWDSLQLADVLVNRLNDVIEQESEQGADRSRLTPVRSLEGTIRFQNVGFRFGGADSPMILSGINLDVPAGRTVAIVGRSGSGKTTLIRCLAGLLEPTEGTILFDGVDMKTLNYRDLRRHIGSVLQENYIFDDTIARNIAFGEDEPDIDRVMWAARAANAHEFIERLPLGYDTKIGESGVGLSGGQRQRVAIARAIHLRPPVLIFDEATSALDTESERAVKENINQLLEGRTAFVIAHRLSTIRDADMIIILEKGRLVERGTHEELMKQQGLYFYLCSQQLGL